MAPYFAIFDRANGVLQWTGKHESAADALTAFDKSVGIDPHEEGLEIIAKHFRILEVTAYQVTSLIEWHERGADTLDYPL